MPTKHYWDFYYYVIGPGRKAVAGVNKYEDAVEIVWKYKQDTGFEYRIKERDESGKLV